MSLTNVTTPALNNCPICRSEMPLPKVNEKNRRCSCGYYEHAESNRIVTLISKILTQYALSRDVLVGVLGEHEIDIKDVFQPNSAMSLFVARTERVHKICGLNAYRGLEFPLRVLADKDSVFKARVIYQSENPTSLHLPALLLADTFEEVHHLTHHDKKSQYMDFIDIGILRNLVRNQSIGMHSSQTNIDLFDSDFIEAIQSISKRDFSVVPSKNQASQRIV